MRHPPTRPSRASRTLIGVLAVVLVAGLIGYFSNASHRPTDDLNPSNPSAANASSPANPGTPPSYLAAAATSPADATAPQFAPDPSLPRAVPEAAKEAANFSGIGSPTEGKAKIDAGDLIAGRKILNDLLIAGQLNAADTTAAKALISKANQTLIFSPTKAKDDPFATSYTVPPGGVMTKIAWSHGTTADFLCRINGIADARRLRAGQQIKMVDGPFHAVVSKSAFTLDLYLGAPGGPGSMFVTTFPVGLGKDSSTPDGTWVVEPKKKLKDPVYYPPPERGGKPIAAGDPANPLGKFWIALKGTEGKALGKTSYGIHGNIDPNSIGKMESMGCIRMRNEDIPLVFEVLIEGKSFVVVKD